ncbi:hypothetical protein Dsin_021397 [Dipteronia sinensis]|uniref:Alpha/beta hydrolase fold-3 domain-containing protein n=1 Tax=Dipteronia sinensis TaxID=43782 RepID=A0AAE0E064_9ROSI|nr:hypothetical protein Dsin_021397 [Dipteronia sinensis]
MESLPHIVENLSPVLQLYSDGTIVRKNHVNSAVPLLTDDSIKIKDLIYYRKHNLHLRLYKPASSSKTSPPSSKFPIIVFLRGGGFCVGSRTWPTSHNCCLRLASGLNALVVSADYRLAPEHRLPAAIEDGFSVMKWLQAQALGDCDCDGWLDTCEVDFDRVFVLGDSSGANIAHHLAVKFRAGSTALTPVRVRGYVLLAPFFGGVVRTRSEEGPSEAVLSLEILDRFWRLSLPAGETRDHPIANPFGPMSPMLEAMSLDPILVVVGGCELLKDRANDYFKRLKAMKKRIHYVEFKENEHGFFNKHPYSRVGDEFMQLLKNFIFNNSY